jgi:hypothetical protein
VEIAKMITQKLFEIRLYSFGAILIGFVIVSRYLFQQHGFT